MIKVVRPLFYHPDHREMRAAAQKLPWVTTGVD